MLTSNAISWAHFQLRGGWRSLFITAGAYGLAIIVLIAITTRLNPRGTTGTAAGWAQALMGLQAAALLLFGGSRISNAIRNDLNSAIIESHRLMPLSPSQAVIGYMTGPSAQAMGVVAVNLLLGIALVSLTGQAAFEWVSANAVLISFSIFIWAVLVLMSFVTRKAFGGIGWVIGLTVFGFATQGMITMLLPGLAVLASPAMGQTVFSLRAGALVLGPNYAFAIAGQGVIGALCFIGAARKYRRADEAAFTPLMGLVLLAAWVGVSIVGMIKWTEVMPWMFRRGFGGDEEEIRQIQVIATTLLSVLTALIAIAAASREHRDWTRRDRLSDPPLAATNAGRSRRPAPPMLVTLVAAGVCACILLAAPDPPELSRLLWGNGRRSPDLIATMRLYASAMTAAVIVSFCVAMSSFIRILHRGGSQRVGLLLALLIPTLWFAPLIVDVARYIASQDEQGPVMTRISTASPVGALSMTWADMRDRYRVSPVAGVLAQAALAATMTALYYGTGTGRRVSRRTP